MSRVCSNVQEIREEQAAGGGIGEVGGVVVVSKFAMAGLLAQRDRLLAATEALLEMSGGPDGTKPARPDLNVMEVRATAARAIALAQD